MAKFLITLGSIELSGEGRGVEIKEVQRVRKAFKGLFQVQPRIRVSGKFERGAFEPGKDGDHYVDQWDLRQVADSGFFDVLSVGGEYLSVKLFTGLNDNRSVRVAPDRGLYVRVRFSLPLGDLEECPKCKMPWPKGSEPKHRGSCRG
jgi:hypothetical protein